MQVTGSGWSNMGGLVFPQKPATPEAFAKYVGSRLGGKPDLSVNVIAGRQLTIVPDTDRSLIFTDCGEAVSSTLNATMSAVSL